MDQANMKMKEIRRKEHRWRRDAEGVFHYRGRCPFNNAVCRALNYVTDNGKEE